MGICVRGASVELPSPTEPEGDIAAGAPLACKRPYQADHKMSVEAATAAVSRALDQAKLKVEDIDILISKGVSPSHLAIDPAIMGPRVGHAVQKELKLPNAFVFDLMDADYTFAMDIAESFFSLHNMKYGLLIHTECSAPGVWPCKETGFTLSDGASCMIIELDVLRPTMGSTYRDVSPEHECLQMRPLEGEALTSGLKRTYMKWDVQDDLMATLCETGSETIAAELERHSEVSNLHCATEDWFPGVKITHPGVAADRMLTPAAELGYLGPHAVPCIAEQLLAAEAGGEGYEYLTGVCFNPFKMRFGSRLMRLRRA